MRSKHKLILGLAGLALTAGIAWHSLSDSADPAVLRDLDAESLIHLRREFNQHAADVRVLVLLSPT
jgi:hypothetical protein